MTSFFSPSRPRLPNGRPCWLRGQGQVALPGIYIMPQELISPHEPPWLTVELLLNGSWVRTTLEPASLVIFLADWRKDPELALELWFRAKAPHSAKSPDSEPDSSLSPNPAISQSAEDLDL